MKQLQNNFTTPEQSKRLLELGVPRWSADEYRDQKGYRHSLEGILDVELFFQNFTDYLPCWSGTRIIEIMKICSIPVTTWYITSDSKQSLIELFMDHLETSILERDIDFSKLEE